MDIKESIDYFLSLQYVEKLVAYNSIITLMKENDKLKIENNNNIIEFLKNNIMLTSSLARNEYYSLDEYPYLVEPMNCLTDEDTREIFFYKSTQSGLTLFMCVASIYFAVTDPSPQGFYLPTMVKINQFRTEKYNPIINASVSIKNYFGNKRSKDNVFSKDLITTNNGSVISFNAMGTVNSLSSSTLKRVFLDEIARFENTKEGDVVDLVRQRVRAVDGNKMIGASTPTHTGSYIDKEWKKTDQRYFNCPCIKCGKFQTLDFDRLVYNKKAKYSYEIEKVTLECLYCNFLIEEKRRKIMLHDGIWIPTKESLGHVRGYFIDHLMTPQENMFLETVRKYIDTRYFDEFSGKFKTNYDKLKSFYNTSITRNFDQSEEVMFKGDDYSELFTTIHGVSKETGEPIEFLMKKGNLPPDVHTITIGIDIQKGKSNNIDLSNYLNKSRIEIHYVGFSDSHTYSLDYDVIHGGNNGTINFLDNLTFKDLLEEKILRKFKTKPNKLNKLYKLNDKNEPIIEEKNINLQATIVMMDIGGELSQTKAMIDFYLSKFNIDSVLRNTRIHFVKGMGSVSRNEKLRESDNLEEKKRFKTTKNYSLLKEAIYHNVGMIEERNLSGGRYSDILTVYLIYTNVVKHFIFNEIKKSPPELTVPCNYPNELIGQLFSEKMVIASGNEITYQKIKADARNEFLDTLTYAICGMDVVKASAEYSSFSVRRDKVKTFFEKKKYEYC